MGHGKYAPAFSFYLSEIHVVAVAREEADGPWQRGIAYKGFGPSVKSVEGIDVERIPSLQEQPVQSAITIPQVVLLLCFTSFAWIILLSTVRS